MTTPNDDKKKNSRIYGRGFHDGLRSAGNNGDIPMMNAARMNELERSINGVARKVLNACPLSEPWEPKEIHAEVTRAVHNIDRRTLEGCLNSLRESGLIREPKHGSFIRVAARPTAVPTLELPRHLLNAHASTPVADQEPLDKLAAIATTLRKFADTSNELAEKVETIGIEVSDQIKRVQEGGAKLRQLQELLKGI